jgi:hypothetical protein
VLNWLRSLYNRYGWPLQGIWNDFINVLSAVQSYDESNLSWVISWINYLYAQSGALSAALFRFVLSSYNPFVAWVERQLFDINVRADQDYKRIGTDIAALQARTNQQITVVQQTVSDGLSGLLQWIIQHIFNPLFGDVTRALDWIAHEGLYVFNLLTHPDLLLAWLLHFLFGQWNTLLDKFGKLMLAWFLGNWKLIAPLVISALEDIIATILLGGHRADSS